MRFISKKSSILSLSFAIPFVDVKDREKADAAEMERELEMIRLYCVREFGELTEEDIKWGVHDAHRIGIGKTEMVLGKKKSYIDDKLSYLNEKLDNDEKISFLRLLVKITNVSQKISNAKLKLQHYYFSKLSIEYEIKD